MDAIVILAIANVLDIVTGLVKAIDQKTLSSKAMKHGIVSKIFIWVMVIVGGLIKYGLKQYIAVDFDPIPLIISYYLIMELISILENVSEYLPVPDKIKELLEQYEKEDK